MRRLSATIVAMEKPTSIVHSECVFVALSTHHAMGIHHIFICDLSGSTIFLYIFK